MHVKIFFDLQLEENEQTILKKWQKNILPQIKKSFIGVKCILKNKSKNLNIIFIDDKQMTDLNYRYRKKKSPTDILTFNYDEPEMPAEISESELYISLDTAFKQAKRNNIPFENEVTILTVHGILHSFGYDHEKSSEDEKKMRLLEEQILKKLGGKNLTPLISHEN
ncbi:MAG: rRNA maturation RNase YbeY [Spirochaetia bacterium]|nr:rRNA maturation RNase YbeY [Spirochaetia bacterium]